MGQNYEEVRDSADILIVGGGIAGLTAAVVQNNLPTPRN